MAVDNDPYENIKQRQGLDVTIQKHLHKHFRIYKSLDEIRSELNPEIKQATANANLAGGQNPESGVGGQKRA